MTTQLYYAPMSSAVPFLWVMAELGIDHEAIQLDLKAGDQKKPEVMAHNPMGQVPTLVDQGQGMFESTAITVYLGERYGVERGLWPMVGSAEHMVALSWNSWFAVSLGAAMHRIMLNTGDWIPKEIQSPGQAEEGRKRFGELMKILDDRLAEQAYVVGERFTLVDVYGATSLAWGTQVIGFDMSTVPNVAAWMGRCMSREGAKTMGF